MKYQEELIYTERKMIIANYYGHKLKYLYYRWKLKRLKKKIQKEGLDG